MDDLKQYTTFLQESKIAKVVKMAARVVIHNCRLSANDLVNIKKRGTYGPVNKKEAICELEVGGQTLAHGKIIKKGGEYFFKIQEMVTEEQK